MTTTAPAPVPVRLTRAAFAKMPKVTEATHFLLAAPLVPDSGIDDSDDGEFDPSQDDSFLSDDEPDAVITLEEFDPLKYKKGPHSCCKPSAEPLAPEIEQRAAQLEAEYQAALAAAAARTARPGSPQQQANYSSQDDDEDVMVVEDDVKLSEETDQVARKVDHLVTPLLSCTSPDVQAYFADWTPARILDLFSSAASTTSPTRPVASFLHPPSRTWLYSSSSDRPIRVVPYVDI